VTLTISHSNSPRTISNVACSHYSMLATIHYGWHLGCLANTCDTSHRAAISDLVGQQG